MLIEDRERAPSRRNSNEVSAASNDDGEVVLALFDLEAYGDEFVAAAVLGLAKPICRDPHGCLAMPARRSRQNGSRFTGLPVPT